MNNFIIWALFDSGNGSYNQVAKDIEGVEVYSIGIDIENKNDHFMQLDLSDYSFLFGEDELVNELDKLPKPDLIIASPPCESWSMASNMKNGNACWKQDKMSNVFGEMNGSKYSVRFYDDYEGYQFKPMKQLVNRINGELTIYNTIKIIRHYKPKYYIVENPAYNKIWEYIELVLGFNFEYDNLAYYSNYGHPIPKPTKFKSNIQLNLKDKRTLTETNMNNFSGYNNRSNIPLTLVQDIFKVVLEDNEGNNNDN